jgi:hypothetical protein
MATESEVRAKAQSAGLSQQQEDQAVDLAKQNPNLDANQVIQQVKK